MGTRPASVDCCPHCSLSPLLLLVGSFSIPEPPSSLALEVLPHLLPASSQQTAWRPRGKGALLLLRVSPATPALLVILPRLHTCPVSHLCHHGTQNTLIMFSDVLKVLSTCCVWLISERMEDPHPMPPPKAHAGGLSLHVLPAGTADIHGNTLPRPPHCLALLSLRLPRPCCPPLLNLPQSPGARPLHGGPCTPS